MLKKIFFLIVLAVFTILPAGCTSGHPDEKEDFMNINWNRVEQITVSTQMTDPKRDMTIESKNWGDLENRLKGYSLKRSADKKEKGWEYLFKIEEKGGSAVLISFMENKVTVNGTVYEAEGYDSSDFLYLFE